MAWNNHSTRERAGKAGNPDLGAESSSFQIKVQSHHDLVDEEVGMLSDAVVKLKGMVKQIGEEGEETGKIQELVAQQLEAAQAAMKSGVKKMQRMHRDMSSSCGHMIVLVLYAVVLVIALVFLTRVKAFLSWIF